MPVGSVGRSASVPPPGGDEPDDATTSAAASAASPAAARGSASTGRMAAVASATSGSTAALSTAPLASSTPPTPEAFADAWIATFGPIIRSGAGADGRMTRPEAERIARRDAPGWLASDDAAAFLKSTGQQTIGIDSLLKRLRDHIVSAGRKVAGSNNRISYDEAKRLPAELQADFLYLRGKGLPKHRTWAELAVEVRGVVSSRFASWPARPLARPPAAVRGERPIIEHLPHPTDPAIRAIVTVADGKIYASIARSGTARPGSPPVGWYDLGPIPPER